jgi:hypothetical protein
MVLDCPHHLWFKYCTEIERIVTLCHVILLFVNAAYLSTSVSLFEVARSSLLFQVEIFHPGPPSVVTMRSLYPVLRQQLLVPSWLLLSCPSLFLLQSLTVHCSVRLVVAVVCQTRRDKGLPT